MSTVEATRLPTYHEFMAHQGAVLTATTPDGAAVSMLIDRVSELRTAGPMQSFSVVLLSDATIPQGSPRFAHEALGAFEMFVVPIGIDGPRRIYESVFTQLVTGLEQP
jgi:hypothetical protein